MTPESRLLRAILAQPDAVPCGHIEHLAAYLAASPVAILLSENDEDEPVVDCRECEVVVSFACLSRPVVGAVQERN